MKSIPRASARLLFLLPLIAFLFSASHAAGPNADGCASCANNSNTPPSDDDDDCDDGGDDDSDPECDDDDDDSDPTSAADGDGTCANTTGGTTSSNSYVHNGRMDYHSWAHDFQLPPSTPGCRSCGAHDMGAGLSSVGVKRYLRSRFEGHGVSSFGRLSSLSGYDRSLNWKEEQLEVIISYCEPDSVSPVSTLSWDSSRMSWAPVNTAAAAYGLALFDAAGTPLAAFADRNLAHTGVFLHADGTSTHYEIIRKGTSVYGRPVVFADRNGNMTTVEYVDPQPAFGTDVTTISEYFRRTKITDTYGRELLFEYELQGSSWLVSKITHPDGEATEYSYSNLSFYGKVISEVDHPDDSTSTETWNTNAATGFWELDLFEAAGEPGKRRKTVYVSTNRGTDSNGNIIVTVPGLTRMVLNGEGEMTYANRTTDTGDRLVYAGGNKAFIVTIGGDTKGLGDYRQVSTAESLQENFFTLDIAALTQAVRLSRTNGNNWRQNNVTDAFGRTRAFPARDPVSQEITRVEESDGTDKQLLVNQFGTPFSVTDRLGRVTMREFDVAGNITEVTRGFGEDAESTEEYIYNANGLLTEKRDPLYDPDYPELHNTRYEYDANKFPTKLIQSADVPGGTSPETLFTWDAAGRLATVTDPQGRIVTYTYDERSRLVTTTYADTSTESVTYGTGDDANLVLSSTDRNGIVTETEYDLADRKVVTRTAAGLPEEITELCTYLPGTHLEVTCIRRGEKTEHAYDGQNRMATTTRHADANTALTTTTEYDILNRRRSTTDAYGRRTFFLYDQNDSIARTVRETVPGGLGTVPDFENDSTQTAEQIEREIELTNGETVTLRGIHEVTYTDPRDLFLQDLTRDLTPNAPYLITDTLTDAEGQTLTTTDPRGIETLMLYDVLGRVLRTFEAITLTEERLTENDYDKASNLIETRLPRHFAETEDDGNGTQVGIRAVETFTYNGRNLRGSRTVAAGHPVLEATESWTYNPDGTQRTHADFRGNADLTLWRACCARLQAQVARDGESIGIQNTDPKGNVVHTATVGEPSFQAASYDYNDPTDSATISETTARFDGLDRPTHTTAWLQPLADIGSCCGGTGEIPIATDPADGLTTTFDYDEDLTDGQGIDLAYASQFTALAARGVTFNADANGFATAVTNPAGETSVTVQDGLGRTVMSINGEGDIHTIRHDGIQSGGDFQSPLPLPIPGDLLATVTTDALGHEHTTFSDGAGRTLLMEDAAGFLSGNAYDASSNLLASRDPNGLGENCEYDALNRDILCADLQEQSETTSRTKAYNAHNAVLTSTDAEGEITSATYDVRDRTETTTDANNLTTSYAYDANGNLVALTDPKNATRSWTYEERNLSVTKAMPDANDTVTYTHDALARLKVVTQQDSSTTEMIYDLAGRMVSRSYSDSTTDTFAYDGASRLLTATKGRHAITTSRTYAADGMQLSETQLLDGRTYTLARTYDADNLVASQTFADGKTMSWAYDNRHLVTGATYDGDPVLGQTHDAGYRLTQQAFGNDLTRDITYGRADNLRTADTVRDGNVTIDELDFGYTYLPDKGVEKETQASGIFDKLSFTAAYDAGNRVISYNRDDTYLGARIMQSWAYDGAGNWDSTTIDGNTGNRTHSASDQLEAIAGDNLTYDARGNQLTDNRDNDYTWDLDNRITESDASAYSRIEYRYDALGRRIVREQSNNREVLLWWGNTEQSSHRHEGGQTTIQNDLQANPSEDALNTVFARAVEGYKQDIQYFHKNYLDHVMAVSAANGNLLEHYRYTAFGEPETYAPNGARIPATAIQNDILWNSRRYEPANGLYMYLYRDYDAASGRWPSRDPIGEEGGINLYGFVGNDGVNRLDYLGLAVPQTRTLNCTCTATYTCYTFDDAGNLCACGGGGSASGTGHSNYRTFTPGSYERALENVKGQALVQIVPATLNSCGDCFTEVDQNSLTCQCN